jgi:hypothetical protein
VKADELERYGAKLQFPSVRLKPGMVLMAGEKNWRDYLRFATDMQRQLLEDALWCGKAQGAGCVGVLEDDAG